jgi:hypothetical protein
MPSPFPGVDPWLEHIDVWHSVRLRLIARSSELLQVQAKRQGFFVEVEERIYIEEAERQVLPDLAIIESPRRERSKASGTVLQADEPVLVSIVSEPEIKERFLQVFDTGSRQLVTQIELISHTNKSKKHGRKQYLRKRKELKRSGVNVVEIDLLRAGEPVVDLPMKSFKQAQPCDYIASTVRQGHAKREAYPILLRERLPRIGIPLREGFSDIVLDLQAALDHVWDHGPYPDRIDYEADPVPPLSPEDNAWADQILRQAGLRGNA